MRTATHRYPSRGYQGSRWRVITGSVSGLVDGAFRNWNDSFTIWPFFTLETQVQLSISRIHWLLLFPDGDLFYDEPGKNPPDHFDVKWACSASRSKRPPCNAVGNWRSSLGGSASSFAPRPKSSHFSLLAVLAFDGSAMSPHFGRNKQKGREQQGTNGAEGTLGTQVNTKFYCCYSARKNVKVFVIILLSILGIK